MSEFERSLKTYTFSPCLAIALSFLKAKQVESYLATTMVIIYMIVIVIVDRKNLTLNREGEKQ